MQIEVAYANVFVSDFERALAFYTDVLRFDLSFADREFKYASFATGPATLAIAETDDEALVGRHTGIGLVVADLDAAYAALKDRATFTSPPERQGWGGYMAIIADPDGNQFYFDEAREQNA